MKWENQWGNFPRSSPVSVDVFDVSVLRRKRNIQVRESAYSTRLFPTLSSINPKEYGRTCETASKSGKQIERSVISTFRIAWSIGSKGEFRQREHLLALPLRSSLTADL